MSLAYAPRGLIGVLTPQASTTVEPELAILAPPGFSFINGRMTSDKATIEGRLADYYASLDRSAAQFGNAPLKCLASVVTGGSYVIGRDAEDRLFPDLSRRLRYPVTNAALAVTAALNALGARRIALVSPYPARLTELSVAYWRSRGFEPGAVELASGDAGSFHQIYTLPAEAAASAIERLDARGHDAFVLLGTGMPTLRAILDHPQIHGVPVFSCLLAFAWHATHLAEGAVGGAGSLLAMITGRDWRSRYEAQVWQPQKV